jgi:nucleoredoxin
VQGIPTFVILDGATGETITTDGRESVGEDPEGKDYPWKPPTLWEALGDEFLQGTEGETVGLEELGKGVEGKVIGLYFSAHWCPPCRGFTPKLVEAYKDHLKAKGLEIVFVSSDRDTASFMEYYKEMPWLAIPQGDARKGKLSKLFGVSGIPSFVLIDAATGKTIKDNARGKITSDPEGKEFPYFPKPLNDMVSEGPGDINETPTLCAMMEGCSKAVVEAALKALEPIAKAAVDKEEEMAFLFARKEGGPTKQIRELTKLGDATDKPQLVLIDIPDSGAYYVSPASEITPDAVQSFLDMYKAKALERQQME